MHVVTGTSSSGYVLQPPWHGQCTASSVLLLWTPVILYRHDTHVVWTSSANLLQILWYPQFLRTEILIYFVIHLCFMHVCCLRITWKRSKHVGVFVHLCASVHFNTCVFVGVICWTVHYCKNMNTVETSNCHEVCPLFNWYKKHIPPGATKDVQ